MLLDIKQAQIEPIALTHKNVRIQQNYTFSYVNLKLMINLASKLIQLFSLEVSIKSLKHKHKKQNLLTTWVGIHKTSYTNS